MSGISPLRVESGEGRVYRDCPIKIREYEFLGDLIELSFKEFVVILGMDWFSRHQVVVNCRMKRVTLRTLNDNEVIFIDERSNHLSNVISAATARKMVRKGCEVYLAYVIDTVKARPSVSDIPTVSDFSDCFRKSCQNCLHRGRLKLLSMLYQVPHRHPLHRTEWLQWS